MFTFPTHPQSPFAVIGNSFKLYCKSFSRIWYWQLLFVLCFGLASVLIPSMQPNMINGRTVYWPGLLAVVIVGFLCEVFVSSFLYSRMHNVATQGDTRVAASFRFAWTKMWKVVLGLSLFYILLLTVCVGLAVFDLTVMYQDMQVMFDIAVSVLVLLAVIFLLFPMMFFQVVALFEGLSFCKSIQRAFSLTWGRWWRIFSVLLLGFGIPLAIVMFTTVPLDMIVMTKGPTTAMLFSVMGAHIVLDTLILPFFLTTILVQFYDLRLRKM